MQNFRDGEVPAAIQLLRQNSVLSAAALDTLQGTILSQLNTLKISYGKISSYEFITEREVKDFIAKRFYILKFEKYYLKFDFTLYKSSSGWAITGFTYNEDLTELLY